MAFVPLDLTEPVLCRVLDLALPVQHHNGDCLQLHSEMNSWVTFN